jgi:hypothetical protein
MTKQEWLKVRQQDELTIGVLFTFYKEMGGVLADIITFQNYLWDCCLRPHIIVQDKFLRVTHETIIHKVFRYYDQKFKLCTNYETTS